MTDETQAERSVRAEFLVERQGKAFVLYAGLLDLAHTQGLRCIKTEVVQIPSVHNEQTAVVTAEVATSNGTFTGIGDASPANVARPMVNVLIRLAETRAKARALRDAVNVGVVALEELGESEPEDRAPSSPPVSVHTYTPAPVRAMTPRSHAPVSTADNLATDAQMRAIYAIGRSLGKSQDAIDSWLITTYGEHAANDGLTIKQASQVIDALRKEQKDGS